MKFPIFALFAATALRAADPVSLQSIIEQTVTQNPELRFYEAEIDAARAGVRSAGTLAEPELSVSAGRKRMRSHEGLAGEGATWSVSVAQTFEWPGRLSLRKAIANHQVQLAELGLARFKAALTARATLLAYGLYGAQEQATATAEVAARYRELREVFLQREPAGLTPQLETRVIEAQEIVLQRRSTAATLAVHSALTELNQLRGSEPNAPLFLKGRGLRFNPSPELEALLVAAHENNFDFLSAKLDLERQGLQVSLSRNERKPAITVSPFLTQESAGDRERTFGLGLTLPLAVSGRTGAVIAAAEIRQQQAGTAVLVAQRRLDREIITTAATFAAKLAERAQWTDDAREKFRDAASLADRHYRLGSVPLNIYVELQTSYLDAVEALLETQQEALEAGLRLRELSGLDFKPVEVLP